MADRRKVIVEGFNRQAAEFMASRLHRDPSRLRRLIDQVAPLAGESGLDVGCGPGIVVEALRQAGAEMIGVDLTPEMLRQAKLEGRGLPGTETAKGKGAAFVQAEVERLPFADARFDFVVCRNTFHHLLDPRRVLVEMARVTRPGGRVVVEDMQAPEDFFERDEHEVVERLRDRTHARTLPGSELKRLAVECGFRIEAASEFALTIDFDEWFDRAHPEPGARERARFLMEEGLSRPRGGRRVFLQDGRLQFERKSLMLRAVRP